MATQNVSTLIAKLESIAKDAPKDEAARKKLYHAAQSLAYAMESPDDTVQRIGFLAVPMTVVRIGIDLKLFEILAEKKGAPMSERELAEETGAEYLLISRILRSLASHEIIEESGENQYAASHITFTLAMPGNVACVVHNFDTILPAWLALPSFLAATNYTNPTDPLHCPFRIRHSTPLPASEWLAQHPTSFSALDTWTPSQHASHAHWLDIFPFKSHLGQNLSPHDVLFVEIGGGGSTGQQAASLRARFPTLPGRVILQDRGLLEVWARVGG